MFKPLVIGLAIGAVAGFLMGHAGAKGGVNDILKRTGMSR